MPDPTQHPLVQALDETINALNYLREGGTKTVDISPAVWSAFVRPPQQVTEARAMPTLPETTRAEQGQAQGDTPELRQTAFNALNATISQCNKCPYAAATRATGQGEIYHPQVAIINGANLTGDTPVAQHSRLEGEAAALLEKMFDAIGVKLSQCYLTPALKCSVPRAPTSDALQLCAAHLRQELRLVCPKAIVLLGPTAAKSLFTSGIAATGKVGQWALLNVGNISIPAITIHHPARILMLDNVLSVTLKRENWAALQALRTRLQA